MRIGAHVSTSGGIPEAPARGAALGAEAIQLFTRNKRRWYADPYPREVVQAWKENLAASGVGTVMVHGSYLVNLAATKPEVHKRSMLVFADEFARCHLLGIPFLDFHPGAHVGAGERAGIETVVESLAEVLDAQPENPTRPLVENMPGAGSQLGGTFEGCAEILDRVDDGRLGVCIDTAHAFAAGHDVRTRDGYESFLGHVDATVGLDRVRAFHLNDSEHALGSRHDRHANIGQGRIGPDLFRFLVTDERFEDVPGILETRDPERWAEEIAMLKAWREGKDGGHDQRRAGASDGVAG